MELSGRSKFASEIPNIQKGRSEAIDWNNTPKVQFNLTNRTVVVF